MADLVSGDITGHQECTHSSEPTPILRTGPHIDQNLKHNIKAEVISSELRRTLPNVNLIHAFVEEDGIPVKLAKQTHSPARLERQDDLGLIEALGASRALDDAYAVEVSTTTAFEKVLLESQANLRMLIDCMWRRDYQQHMTHEATDSAEPRQSVVIAYDVQDVAWKYLTNEATNSTMSSVPVLVNGG